MFRPSTLTSAIGLARLQESKVGARRGLNRSDVPSPPAAPAKKVVNPTRPIFPRMKRLRPAEAESRRNRGFLCYTLIVRRSSIPVIDGRKRNSLCSRGLGQVKRKRDKGKNGA